jgi:hypothetical protein
MWSAVKREATLQEIFSQDCCMMTWHAVTHLADTRAAAASSSGVNGTAGGLRRIKRLGDGRAGGIISICPEVLVEGRDRAIGVGAGVGEGGDGSWLWTKSGVEGEGEWGRESRDGVDIVSAVLIPVTVGQRRDLSFHTLNFYISIDDSSFTSLSSRPIAVFTLFIKSAAASASSELLPATSSNNPLASSRSPPSNT